MKVAVQCRSLLLQKSLEIFLSKQLVNLSKSDIIIRDEPCYEDSRCFYIGSDERADLKKPFSKSELILALEKKYGVHAPQEEVVVEEDEKSIARKPIMNFEILEKRIELLTEEYQANIIQAVKAFYEN